MKTKIYLRIGLTKKGRFIASASAHKPNYESLKGTPHYGVSPVLPTLAFAVEFDFPDQLIKQAEIVAARVNLAAKDATVCGTVIKPKAVPK